MSRFLERYLDGQHEQVWTELVSLGPYVRREPEYRRQARLVAEETMRRVRENLERLVVELPRVGYVFANPDRVLGPPPTDVGGQVARLEARLGPVPLAFAVFWELVGTVDLSGSHPDWPHELLDPLMFEASADFFLDTFEDDEDREPGDAFELEFAPDDLHKADISGGAPYAIRVPDPCVDGLVVAEPHQTTFNQYLRIVLRTAGMGGMGAVRHHAHPLYPTPPEIERIAAGLLSF